MTPTISASLSNYSKFQDLIAQYLLPDEYTAEDIVKRWVDPVRREDIDRLPYFALPINEGEFTNIFTAEYIKNFKASPVDFFESIPTDEDSSTDEIKQLVQNVMNPSSTVNTLYQDYAYEFGSRLFLRAITLVNTKAPVQGQLLNFSSNTRVINYADKMPELITMDIVVYNTIATPWFEMILKIFNYILQKKVDEGAALLLYVPYAVGNDRLEDTIYNVFDCELINLQPSNSLRDTANIRMTLLVNKRNNTKVTVKGKS